MVKAKKVNVVGVEILKKNGLDVDKLIKLLITIIEFAAENSFFLIANLFIYLI